MCKGRGTSVSDATLLFFVFFLVTCCTSNTFNDIAPSYKKGSIFVRAKFQVLKTFLKILKRIRFNMVHCIRTSEAPEGGAVL